jgi:hypothetical protein
LDCASTEHKSIKLLVFVRDGWGRRQQCAVGEHCSIA